ncbi:Tyrosine-protein kinase receptor Tie-2 [Araneus ventricosus]|uniref:Tyrosine-protein kinase receptor Tie-2 n=1 Tax=Araneus ventricosus TaxID=182803 RepID=A0A4Y2H652_ARAVE|nr:Tyrosine-protein kinase receptor Tie-2 [Araneus ventricosus]
MNNERPSTIFSTRGDVKLFAADWKAATKGNGKLNAGYQCFIQNNTLSTLTSLAFRKDAYFYPSRLTVTANVNEEVHLEMIEKEVCEGHVIWRKNGDRDLVAISYNDSQTSITFPAIEVGHSGIYSLECSNSDISRAGFVQLIVRACPKGKYGNNCTQNCSVCLNGGICHDLNGKCICPPGFYGHTCEKVPPPPADLRVTLSISSALFFVWSSAFPPGGLLDYYKILYRDLRTNYTDSDILNNTLEDECRNQTFEYCHAIRGLTPNHKYEIQVLAFNKNVSTGSEAVTVTATTSPSDPIADFKISILRHGENEVFIKVLPGNTNSSIYRAFLIVVDAVDDYHHPNQIDLSSDIHKKSRCKAPPSYNHTYIAAEIPNIPRNGMNLTVGNKSCLNGYYNRPLKSGKMYRIGIAAIITFCQASFFLHFIFLNKPIV